MFALVSLERGNKDGLLKKIVRAFKRESEICFFEDILLGVRILKVKIPVSENEKEAGIIKKARGAAEYLAQSGIKKAVYQDRFPYKEEFTCFGIREPDKISLYKELAYKMCIYYIETMKEDAIGLKTAIFARRLTKQVERTVLALCGKARHISLHIECGAKSFIESLRADYGVSVIDKRIKAIEEDTDIFVFFDKPTDPPQNLKEGAVSIMLYDGYDICPKGGVYTGAKLKIMEMQDNERAHEYDTQTLIAALFHAGAVGHEKIEILFLDTGI